MVEGESVTSEGPQETTAAAPVRMTRTYAYIWDNFVVWCKSSGRASLPAATEDVADYIRERADAGARPSTLRVIAAAIARRHDIARTGQPVRIRSGAARTRRVHSRRDARSAQGSAARYGLLPCDQGDGP